MEQTIDKAKEGARLDALLDLGILDTDPEAAYEHAIELATRMLNMPMGAVSLVDSERQWFKASRGLDVSETPREHAFCSVAIEQETRIMVVSDATLHPRFRDNPLVTGALHLRFYAGATLLDSKGRALGTLCVLDTEARTFSDAQADLLITLADLVTEQLEQRRKSRALEQQGVELRRTRQELTRVSSDLHRIVFAASNELRTPLRALQYSVKWLYDDMTEGTTPDSRRLLAATQERIRGMRALLDSLVEYTTMDEAERRGPCDASAVLDAVLEGAHAPFGFVVEVDAPRTASVRDPETLERILGELVDNALRHHHGERGRVRIEATPAAEDHLEFRVLDDGPGIAQDERQAAFRMFETLGARARGSGLGLTLARRVVLGRRGRMELLGAPGGGTEVRFTWPLETPVEAATGALQARITKENVSNPRPDSDPETGRDERSTT